MPSMTIKSMPDTIYQSLKINAKLNHRSLNGEAIASLERSLGMTKVAFRDRLNRIDALRLSVKSTKLSDKVLNEAKVAGRP